jgi:hypothetical protein
LKTLRSACFHPTATIRWEQAAARTNGSRKIVATAFEARDARAFARCVKGNAIAAIFRDSVTSIDG